MSIILLFTDLRTTPSRLLKYRFDWEPNQFASNLIQQVLGEKTVKEIEKDFSKNNPDIIVSWFHKDTKDVSEIGGVGSLRWIVQDNTIITIAYENENTTEQQIEEVINWTLNQDLL